ncbi:MAG: glycine zipper 2TM domain-containing protein [Gammaproteobacteria bacterium]
MNARILNTALIAALAGVAGTAQAGPGYGDDFTVRARVVASTPIYETINEPRRECWTETVGYETRSSSGGSGGAIIGAIAGGLLGSTVGKGDGRVAAAAVGAATGAVVGDRMGKHARYETVPQQVERCRTTDNFRQVISGYDVRYRFQDREYATRLPYDPGNWVTLNVRFSVAEDARPGRFHSSRNKWRD